VAFRLVAAEAYRNIHTLHRLASCQPFVMDL